MFLTKQTNTQEITGHILSLYSHPTVQFSLFPEMNLSKRINGLCKEPFISTVFYFYFYIFAIDR